MDSYLLIPTLLLSLYISLYPQGLAYCRTQKNIYRTCVELKLPSWNTPTLVLLLPS